MMCHKSYAEKLIIAFNKMFESLEIASGLLADDIINNEFQQEDVPTNSM